MVINSFSKVGISIKDTILFDSSSIRVVVREHVNGTSVTVFSKDSSRKPPLKAEKHIELPNEKT